MNYKKNYEDYIKYVKKQNREKYKVLNKNYKRVFYRRDYK